ncbi:MAG: hypothetical protein HC904_09935 [Blastochloris sp.]|nr:hypothetical protein [Blastochloris sp.]
MKAFSGKWMQWGLRRILMGSGVFLLGSILNAQDLPLRVSVERVVDVRSAEADESRISLTLKLEGEVVAQALEYGQVELAEPAGWKAKVVATDAEGFAPLKHRGLGKGREATLLLELPSPPRTQTSLPVLAGHLTLKTYRQQVVLIQDLRNKRNQTMTDPLFEAHGIKVRVVEPRQAFPGLSDPLELTKLEESCVAVEIIGDIRKVREILLETPEGEAIPSRSSSFGAGRTLILALRAEQALPEKVVAKILIPVAPQSLRVPFRLENVSLP